MSATKQCAATLDIIAGTTLIMVGIVGSLARLDVININQLPHWTAIEHWWPLLLIIAGLVMWLSDTEDLQTTRQSRQRLEIPYGVALVSEGHKYLRQQTIASLESELDPKCFLRVHRSYIINLERVAKIEPYGKESRVAILHDDTRLPVSRAGYERLRIALEES